MFAEEMINNRFIELIFLVRNWNSSSETFHWEGETIAFCPFFGLYNKQPFHPIQYFVFWVFFPEVNTSFKEKPMQCLDMR